MGWFSKTVPERKWPEVFGALPMQMKKDSDGWYANFVESNPIGTFGVKSGSLTPPAKRLIDLHQLMVFTTTLQEFNYVSASGVTFVTELVYIGLTGNRPEMLEYDLVDMPRGGADAHATLDPWSRKLANEISTSPENPKLIEALRWMGVGMLVTTKALVCRACGDHRRADQLLRSVRS